MIQKVRKFVYQHYILQRRRMIQKPLPYYYKARVNLILIIRFVITNLKFYFLQINLKINREEVLLIVQQRFVFSMSRWCFVLFTIVYLMVLESFYCSMLSSYFIILIFSFSFYSLAE